MFKERRITGVVALMSMALVVATEGNGLLGEASSAVLMLSTVVSAILGISEV